MKILLRIVKQVLQLRNLFKRQCQFSALHFERARKSNDTFITSLTFLVLANISSFMIFIIIKKDICIERKSS